MSCCNAVKKGAGERLDWTVDYADWLVDGDTLVDAEATIGTDLVAEPVIEGDVVLLWLSGGVAGASYLVRLKITTAGGRVRTDCVKIRVR